MHQEHGKAGVKIEGRIVVAVRRAARFFRTTRRTIDSVPLRGAAVRVGRFADRFPQRATTSPELVLGR